jgi:integrase/recombinase XerD
MTFYATGMRLSELLHFKLQDIDSSRMVIKIMGKGRKERYITLSDLLLEQLRNYWRKFKPTAEFFISACKKPYHPRTIAHIIEDAKKLAHITKPGGAHMFRHSYATHLYEAGVCLLKLSSDC